MDIFIMCLYKLFFKVSEARLPQYTRKQELHRSA